MNTLQLIGMGVWLAITLYLTYTTVIVTIDAIVKNNSIELGFLTMTSSVGWAGIILYYTFN